MPAVPSPSTSPAAKLGAGRPAGRTLGWLVGGALVLHVALLSGLAGTLDWRLAASDSVRVSPMQTRWVPPVAPPSAPTEVPSTAKARTRVASIPKPPAKTPEPDTAPPVEVTEATLTPAEPAVSEPIADPSPPVSETTPSQGAASAQASVAPAPPETTMAAATPPASTALESLPPIPLGALPPPVLLSYRLTGQEKGLMYYASGELRWQHNEAAYAMSLSVKAFLLGARYWRSQGDITAAGLAPTRFSDSWRNERAAHFDRANNRVVFSNNAPVAALGPGAQDQISLYLQLAAAMAGDPQRFQPGTRLQIQTVTLKDALPWLLTLEQPETLTVDGQAVSTSKWVCQPRNRFDAKVEFWVSAQHAWMPVRIRITQVSGNFIDLVLSGQEALPPLPAVASVR